MNPLNPLDWIKSTQDWFRTTELSSGFRPYLIFLLIATSAAICLLTFFSQIPSVVAVALALLVISFGAFIILFGVKSFQDPRFCRSEKHVEKIFKMELEKMGTESLQVDAHVIEQEMIESGTPDPQVLPQSSNTEGS